MQIKKPNADRSPAPPVARRDAGTLVYRVLAHTQEATPQIGATRPDPANARLAAALLAAALPHVAEGVAGCGMGPTAWDARPGCIAPVIDANTGRPFRWLASCHHRLCGRCAPARAAKYAKRLGRLLDAAFGAVPLLVTLTRASQDGETVGDAASAIKAAFVRLRRVKAWRPARGGFFTVEFAGRDGRHVHLHVVADAGRLDQGQLLVAWRRALRPKDCPVAVDGGAHVDRARDTDAVVRYVLKGSDPTGLGDDALAEIVRCTHGRRLVQTFGHIYGKQVADPRPTSQCPPRAARSVQGCVNAHTGQPVPFDAIEWRWEGRP